MSVSESSNPETVHKRVFHCRNNSDEIDVFEAASYFSTTCTETVCDNASTTFAHKIMSENKEWKGGRICIDVPLRNHLLHQRSNPIEKQMKEKKHKQPGSPGGRLASFLNSLFNQSSAKKEEAKSMKDEDESLGGRRKRRSSISQFPSSSTADSKSIYSSSSSGFITPPPSGDLGVSLSTPRVKFTGLKNEALSDERHEYCYWVDEKLSFRDGFLEKNNNLGNVCEGFKKFNDVDEGAESDSSSDLFELQNYDLGLQF